MKTNLAHLLCSFLIYKHTFGIEVLHEGNDLMPQLACILCCGEKLDFHLFKRWLLFTLYD